MIQAASTHFRHRIGQCHPDTSRYGVGVLWLLLLLLNNEQSIIWTKSLFLQWQCTLHLASQDSSSGVEGVLTILFVV
jgi:hypothetical protein